MLSKSRKRKLHESGHCPTFYPGAKWNVGRSEPSILPQNRNRSQIGSQVKLAPIKQLLHLFNGNPY